jgi:hypothetical protein
MPARHRSLSVLVAASYLLAITSAARFHNHGPCGDDGGSHCVAAEADASYGLAWVGREAGVPAVGASHGHDADCPVCQFLTQKPAPACYGNSVGPSALVEELASPSPLCAAGGVFSAWYSRAPPACA